jgi:hypothetical protein
MYRLVNYSDNKRMQDIQKDLGPGKISGPKSLVLVLIFICTSGVIHAQKKGFAFVERSGDKQIDVMYNNQLLTSYCYYDSVMKPVLYPLKTVSGTIITRGYPLNPVPGERADHPHHIGLWLNYESVNGLDFWNNSTARPYERRSHYGTIYHNKVVSQKATKNDASLEVSALWKTKAQQTLLSEDTRYNFQVKGSDFIIDRITTLRGEADEVIFKDVKDGFLAIRVARELELPASDKAQLVNKDGNVSEERSTDHSSATATYLSSENLRGNDVWGTRAKWVTLSGKKDGKDISITIIDHPNNPGYPAYWHARDYGLFAVNPLGQEVFSKGKEKLNLTLKKGESVTFKYRIIISEGTSFDAAKQYSGFAQLR